MAESNMASSWGKLVSPPPSTKRVAALASKARPSSRMDSSRALAWRRMESLPEEVDRRSRSWSIRVSSIVWPRCVG